MKSVKAQVRVSAALILGLLAGCMGTGNHAVVPDRTAPGEVRYLALGDSYTIGAGVNADLRWPVQLAAGLRASGVAIGEPGIIARTGWTTDELSAGIDRAAPSGSFEIVSLLIGVNNQYRGRAAEEYRTEFRTLLQRAIGFAGGHADRVVVLSIPDWGVTPFARTRNRSRIATEIGHLNQVNREETERAGAHYVDVTPQSRSAAADRSMLASDGLHPSAKMYAEWARLALPAARQAVLGHGAR